MRDLLQTIVRRSDFTVRTDAAHPQFPVRDSAAKRPVPQTAENCDAAAVDPQKETKGGLSAFFERIPKLLRSWLALLSTLFGALFA